MKSVLKSLLAFVAVAAGFVLGMRYQKYKDLNPIIPNERELRKVIHEGNFDIIEFSSNTGVDSSVVYEIIGKEGVSEFLKFLEFKEGSIPKLNIFRLKYTPIDCFCEPDFTITLKTSETRNSKSINIGFYHLQESMKWLNGHWKGQIPLKDENRERIKEWFTELGISIQIWSDTPSSLELEEPPSLEYVTIKFNNKT